MLDSGFSVKDLAVLVEVAHAANQIGGLGPLSGYSHEEIAAAVGKVAAYMEQLQIPCGGVPKEPNNGQA